MPVLPGHLQPTRGGLSVCAGLSVAAIVAVLTAGPVVVWAADGGGETSSAEKETSESGDESSDDDLTVETVAEPETPQTDPKFPSGWVTRIRPDRSFSRGHDLGDSLEKVEGFSVQRRSSLGQPSFATVRGGNPRQMTVSLNGIRIGAPAGVGFDIGNLSTSWIDDVDVYRGAAAAPFGSGALTGAIDLRTRPPEEAGWSTSATAMGGSFGTRGFGGQAAASSESVGLELDVNLRGSRGDFGFVDQQGVSHTRINNGHGQLSLAGTAGLEADSGDYNATLIYEDKTRGAPGPSEFQDSYRESRVDSSRSIAIVDWEKRGIASGGWGAIDARAAAGYIRRELTYGNPESFLSGNAVRSDSTHESGSVVAGLSGYFSFGDFLHVNLEGRTDRYDASQDFQTDSTIEADRQTLSVGASNELLLFDERVSLVAGLRAGFVDGRDGPSTPVVPSGGLVWRITDWIDFKTNIARTHRLPDFDELYLRTETIRGNPNLAPERALNADAGFAVNPDELPVGGQVTAFYNDIDQMILFLPQSAYLFEAQNLSGAVSRGVEASVRLTVDERLRSRASYTLTDAFLDANPSVQLARHARHRGTLSNRLELAGLEPLGDTLHSLRLTADVDARSSVNLDNFGNLRNRPFWQVDAGVMVEPTRHVRLGVEVQNVTDNRWGADQLQRPLPGRAVYGSLKLMDGSGGRE